MIKGNFEFEFLSPSRCVLGISYTKGVMHEQDGIDKDFHEILLGFIFFNISLLL